MFTGGCPRTPSSTWRPWISSDHVLGIAVAEGYQAEGDVPEDFDHDAAESKHHHGAELRVRGHPHDHLGAGRGHFLHGDAPDDGVGLSRLH